MTDGIVQKVFKTRIENLKSYKKGYLYESGVWLEQIEQELISEINLLKQDDSYNEITCRKFLKKLIGDNE